MSKVSIVMPSLNVRAYIEKCMETVLGQTLEDIEIICVDADSTDGTHEILEQYARRDSRVRLFRDDQHSTGYAKNLGIDMARGEYVGIVEPDDYIEKDMYERLYKAAVADRADVVKCDYSVYVTIDGRKFSVPKKLAFNNSDYGVLMNPQETLKPFGWEMYTWAGIYRTDFLREKGIRHHETKGAAYQDIGFWFQCFAESEKVKLIPGTGYLYCQDNPNSSVKNSNRLIRGLDELEFVKSLYEGKQKWEHLQSAWGLELFRFVNMASGTLSGESLQILLSRAHEMLKMVSMGKDSKNALFGAGGYARFQLLSDSWKAFEKTCQEISKNQQKLKALIEKQEKLVIVSAGSHGANLQILLKKRFNREIELFADNDVGKQGQYLNGVMVMSPTYVVRHSKNCFYLVANQIHGESLMGQLRELGVEDKMMENIPVDMVTDTYL